MTHIDVSNSASRIEPLCDVVHSRSDNFVFADKHNPQSLKSAAKLSDCQWCKLKALKS